MVNLQKIPVDENGLDFCCFFHNHSSPCQADIQLSPLLALPLGELSAKPTERAKNVLQKILQHASFDLTLHVRFEQREDLIRPSEVCRSIGMPAGAAGVGADAQSDEIGIVLEDLRNVSLVLASPVVEE